MKEARKQCIGIIFGGVSNEHDVSIASTKSIYEAFNSNLNKQKYIVKLFYINKNGSWFGNDHSLEILNGHKDNYKEINILEISYSVNFLENIDFSDIDIWFPLIHGNSGEDGTLQGLLRLTQKPYVGSGILGSTLGMDKLMMKLIFTHLKIPQVNYYPINNYTQNNSKLLIEICDEIIEKLSFPLFIKPSNSGSSLGISKINHRDEISSAIKKAGEIDSRIIVEEGHIVRELECGIIGKSYLKSSKVGEINYSSDWYDYESKYSKKNQVIIPADIDSNMEKIIKDLSIKGCKALNIYGFARADFFLDMETNNIYLNEINTIPGFTHQSMFPMLWHASGLGIDQLVARLVDIAIES
ncbi:MAG: D-alanine--D-alanine ligase [Prochlorococcus sp. SP3034]|nr:D-alanine--D-alanine ligase [Prochlorococcus sp. SP3034]|tara:strand:+ start:1529 stop:2593 length:1065 start_codon:yes stop_codon:yes gene_type:complete